MIPITQLPVQPPAEPKHIPLEASGAGPLLGARVIVRDNPSPLTYPAAASLSPTKKLVAYTDSAAVYGVVFDVA